MENRPMYAGGGLSNGKLALANAALAEVLSGKTFYSGDKTLKTGTMPNRGAWNGVYSNADVTIPKGYHNGSGKVSVDGGNRGAWGTTINPGGSAIIPKGWHNGSGKVTANPASSVISFTALETDAPWGDNGVRWTSASIPASGKTIRVYVSCRPSSDQNVNATLQLLGDGVVLSQVEMSRDGTFVLNTTQVNHSSYQLRINQTYHAGDGTYILRGIAIVY